MKASLGIYIHVPFCIQKCRYCDFCSFPNTDSATKSKYVDRLISDIRASAADGYTVDTIYFGGGTPSCLDIDDVGKIMRALTECFDIAASAEVTFECNPATAGKEYFCALRSLGINRLSLGLQSASDAELALIGRAHSVADFEKCFSDARGAGFDNISVDLMYGIPDQTLDTLKDSLDFVLRLCPEHVSLYGLMIEDGTYLAKHADEFALADDDTQCDMYIFASEYLRAHGFKKYEISNFAREGLYSRHNMRYWCVSEYFGFGVAAHSFFKNRRYGNSNDINSYLEGKDITCEMQDINPSDALCEYVMLNMRLSRGIDAREYEALWQRSFAADFASVLGDTYREFLTFSGGRLYFTDKGFFVSNEIILQMLDGISNTYN